jgi:hypothetical protein
MKKGKWEKELHRQLKMNQEIGRVDSTLEEALVLLIAQVEKEAEERIKTNISLLRQWLNEDRITDPSKMVTNEQLERWLLSSEEKE